MQGAISVYRNNRLLIIALVVSAVVGSLRVLRVALILSLDA